MKRRGLFVTFEGIEGSGKSTQLRLLAAWLRKHDISCVVTREPGGTRAGDAIRTIFLGPSGHGLDPWAELFLVEAARAQHLEEVVRPALAAGRVVLCDRFTDSTLAYQGSGRGLPQPVIRRLHRLPALRPAPYVRHSKVEGAHSDAAPAILVFVPAYRGLPAFLQHCIHLRDN